MRRSLREVVTGCGLLLLGLMASELLFAGVLTGFVNPARASAVRLGLMIFLGSFLGISVIAALFQRFELKRPFLRGWVAALYWMSRWLGWVGILVALGGLIGTAIFFLAGISFDFERTLAELVRQGMRDGAFYFLVWAPGGAAVACVIEARARGTARRP